MRCDPFDNSESDSMLRLVHWFRNAVSVLIALFAEVQGLSAQTIDAPTQAKPYIFGSRHCTGCHDQPGKSTGACRMTEWLTWNRQDQHRIAFDWFDEASKDSHVGVRARAIAENLGIADLHQAKQCLGCHSLPVKPETPTSYFERPIERSREGVTCVACHGASKEWVIEHVATADPDWKNAGGSERWQKYGLVDSKNPVVQARLCISCHVGDTDESLGRTITHAMYQAGHPPLPSIEISAFVMEQPRHWLHSNEKKAPARPTASAVDLLAVSGLTALRAQLALFSESESQRASSDGIGPELAGYDCAACHHVLGTRQSRLRQSRARKGTPGRPRLPDWPRILVRLGLTLSDPDRWQETERKLIGFLDKIDAEIAGNPFGIVSTSEGSSLRESLKLIDAQLARLHERWEKKGALTDTDSKETTARFLDSIIDDVQSRSMDYDSARQVGWALRTLLDRLDAELRLSIAEDLSRLDRSVGLTLRPVTKPTDPAPTGADQVAITELLAERLKLANAWNAAEFDAVLRRIRERLQP
jgi:hypothetical protein